MGSYYANKIRELIDAADIMDAYDKQENELIKLTGFNVSTLVNKLKAGYTIEPPKDDKRTPHLINYACSDDWAQGMRDLYIINQGYTWDDLTDYEKRLMYETLKYELYKKRR